MDHVSWLVIDDLGRQTSYWRCPFKVKQVTVERVIQRETNSTEEAKAAGVYRFKQGINKFYFIFKFWQGEQALK